jgi:methyl-accepting chemotaxis protein
MGGGTYDTPVLRADHVFERSATTVDFTAAGGITLANNVTVDAQGGAIVFTVDDGFEPGAITLNDGATLRSNGGDIDRVTRELSDLIQRISQEALREAESANVVAANIQHIFAVTEQTSEGTRSTAQMVRELSRTAEELKASVARFKIS